MNIHCAGWLQPFLEQPNIECTTIVVTREQLHKQGLLMHSLCFPLQLQIRCLSISLNDSRVVVNTSSLLLQQASNVMT